MRLGCWGPRICFFNLKFIETEQCEAAYSFIIARLSIHNKSGRSSDAKEQLNESRLSSSFFGFTLSASTSSPSSSLSLWLDENAIHPSLWTRRCKMKIIQSLVSCFSSVFVLTVFPCSPHASLRVDILWSEKRNNEAFSASFLLSHWKNFLFERLKKSQTKKKCSKIRNSSLSF